MFKKWIMMLPNLFIIVISLSLAALIIVPIVQYSLDSKETIQAIILSEKTQAEPAIEWMLQHNKVGFSHTLPKDVHSIPNLIILKDARKIDEGLISAIQHNVLMGEMLASSEYITSFGADKLNYLFGITFSGFRGKTYSDLADTLSVPEKIISLYESTYNKKWDFKGEGIVFASDTSLLILKKGIDYTGNLIFEDNRFHSGFNGNFEVLNVKDNTNLSSKRENSFDFVLSTTDAGKEKLKKLGLPSRFPAVIKTESLLYKGTYFAGDFSNTKMTMPYYMKGVEKYLENRGIYERNSNEKVFWKWYSREFSNILGETLQFNKTYSSALLERRKNASFIVENLKIKKVSEEKTRKDFFINGVNLGPALPGKTFTEFPTDTNIYAVWIEEMSRTNMNTVRLYTLLPPEFYKALYEFNLNNEKPIYLLQEIWPEENPPASNYLDAGYNQTYRKEIEYAVNAIHGNVNIEKRAFRSYGAYTYDVSPYLVGYLVGREMEPAEVIATNHLNNGYMFSGKYFYSEPDANPTEGWLAASCDYALEVEEKNYHGKPLVAIVNWPTLDPINHPSEWNLKGLKSLQYNDKITVDINHIGTRKDEIAGFFGAYHIYPNYPDFINNDPLYNSYTDAEGRFRYGGYLKEFMSYQKKYPAVVAEYGLSSSMSTAHFSPDGYNHGGLSETAQAYGLIRMNKAIREEGYSGAVIFEWIDEWAKKTWVTENYMIPYNQHVMWHNLLDPEQNYGLLAVKAKAAKLHTIYENSMNHLLKIEGGQNSSSLQFNLSFANLDSVKAPVKILISTHDVPNETRTWEFALLLKASPKLLVNPGYNWIKGHYHSLNVPESSFEEMVQLTNPSGIMKTGEKYPSRAQNLSVLRTGKLDENISHIEYNGNMIRIKLPYGLLGISNPANAEVLEDEKTLIPDSRDQISIMKSDKLDLKIILSDNTSFECSLPLKTWKEPEYEISEKQGLRILTNYFQSMEK